MSIPSKMIFTAKNVVGGMTRISPIGTRVKRGAPLASDKGATYVLFTGGDCLLVDTIKLQGGATCGAK